jgi:prophage regulatory protein
MERKQPRRFMRFGRVQEMVAISRSTLYELMAKGQFPKPVSLGPRNVAWLEDEVTAWQDARIAQRDGSKAA